MTALIDYEWFAEVQRRAERVRIKLRRFEGGGVVRHFVKRRGVSHELQTAADVQTLLADIAALEAVYVDGAPVNAPPEAP